MNPRCRVETVPPISQRDTTLDLHYKVVQHGADSCSEQNTHITPSDRMKVTYNKSPIAARRGACSSKFVAHFRHSACQYEAR